MSAQKTLVTADELLRMPDDGRRYELARGELIEMAPAGARHGRIASRIDRRLGTYVEQSDLGEVFTAEPGFRLERDPDTVRAPDVGFVSNDRLPPGELPKGFFDISPDLVVEVISPSDTADSVQAKLEEWLRHGVRLVWLVYPETRSVAVYRALDDARVLTEQDQLSGEPVLPSFSCPLSDIF